MFSLKPVLALSKLMPEPLKVSDMPVKEAMFNIFAIYLGVTARVGLFVSIFFKKNKKGFSLQSLTQIKF